MTNEASGAKEIPAVDPVAAQADSSVLCAECGEENKKGSTRCARCGAALPEGDGSVDPELRDFNIAQARLAEQLRQERRKTILRDILGAGGTLFGPR